MAIKRSRKWKIYCVFKGGWTILRGISCNLRKKKEFCWISSCSVMLLCCCVNGGLESVGLWRVCLYLEVVVGVHGFWLVYFPVYVCVCVYVCVLIYDKRTQCSIPGKYPDFVPLHVPLFVSTDLYVEASTAFYVDFLQHIKFSQTKL